MVCNETALAVGFLTWPLSAYVICTCSKVGIQVETRIAAHILRPTTAHSMATRRRIGVSAATTEAARRQLMQPVPCWEQAWVPSDVNPSLKVYKWVKTEKVQVRSLTNGRRTEV